MSVPAKLSNHMGYTYPELGTAIQELRHFPHSQVGFYSQITHL